MGLILGVLERFLDKFDEYSVFLLLIVRIFDYFWIDFMNLTSF